MESKHLVSIIIPTYEANEVYLRHAIDSVFAQTYKDYELIVVDDNSKKTNIAELLASYGNKLRLIRKNRNEGTAATRNVGICTARGEYIALLDQDDTWLPDYLEKQVGQLQKNPSLGMVGSSLFLVDSVHHDENDSKAICRACARTPTKGISGIRRAREIFIYNWGCPSATVFRRTVFDTIGLFDESLSDTADLDLRIRIASRFPCLFVNEPLGYYRLHDSNVSRKTTYMQQKTIHYLMKLIKCPVEGLETSLVLKKIARIRYQLGRAYFEEKKFREAFNLILKAIHDDPAIGLQFVEKEDTWGLQLLKILKPYLAVIGILSILPFAIFSLNLGVPHANRH